MEDDKLKMVGKRFGSLSDLPKELREQLQTSSMDELGEQILEVMKSFEGIASIDEVLVGIYRKYGVIEKRPNLANKMYKMCKDEFLHSVSGRRGVYSIK